MTAEPIINNRDHPSWKLYRITYRSGRYVRIWAPTAASAREQATYRGDAMDRQGAHVIYTEDVTPTTGRCTAKYDSQRRCELPKGHDGQHARGVGDMRLTWDMRS